MKSRQLLSVVFSLIMFTGVTAGSTAFAESDDVIEDFEDCVEAGYPVMESYPEKCMTKDGKVFTNTEDDYDDDDRYENDFDLDELLDDYCELNDEEKRQLIADHPRLAPFTERLANYCEMSDDEQDTIDELIKEHGDEIRSELRDYSKDHNMDYKKDMREHLEEYCEMSDEDKKAFVEEHDKAKDHVEKMNRYCSLDENGRTDFIEEHRDEYKADMKEKMHDKMSDKKHDKMTDKNHMDYAKLCEMTESERALEITDVAKLDRLSDWCEMTPVEQEDYKKEHHGDKKHDMKMDNMSDVAIDRMSNVAKDKHHEKVKMSDKSNRLKAMIMDKHDISDERHDEIKMKYKEKHGEMTDKKKSELKMKYNHHMKTMKHTMSDERKSDVHDRVAEMKAYKAELREKSPNMTDEEKQQLREEFIEKAKDLQLAWITPRTQMTAGIDAAEVECREGYSLVMKASNGVAMCLKADTALKMIDRGIVVPAN